MVQKYLTDLVKIANQAYKNLQSTGATNPSDIKTVQKAFVIVSIIVIIFVFLIVIDYLTTNKKNKEIIKKNKHPYSSTVFLAAIYSIGAIYLILKNNFYPEIKNILFSSRYMWCVTASLFGFSLRISQKRFDEELLYLRGLIFYPFGLLCIASLIYSLLSLRGSLSLCIIWKFIFSY